LETEARKVLLSFAEGDVPEQAKAANAVLTSIGCEAVKDAREFK